MSRVRVGVAFAVVAATALLSGCGPSSTSDAHALTGAAHDKRSPLLVGKLGGTVTVALPQVPTTLNDHTFAGDNPTTKWIASAIWPQVFQVAPGQTPALDTNVVQSAELVGVNPQTVVYTIDRHAVWSDGVPITAADFVYAWQSQRGGASDVDGQPDSVASTLGYRDITSVTGSNDGRTVTVVFRTPFGDWASLFDDLLPAHVAERVGWNTGFNGFDPDVLVSGGPWQVQSWQPGSQLVLERNPRWWGSLPHLDRIVVEATSDTTALVRNLRSGSAQVAYPSAFDSTLLAQLTSSSNLQTTESLGTTMLELVFNTKHAPFDSATVREGIAHTLDRASMVTDLVQPIDPSVWEDNNHLFANTQPQYTDDAGDYVHDDPVAAAHLLGQSGMAQDTNGTWVIHGAPVTIQLAWAYDDAWSNLVEPAVDAQLTAAGFDVSLEPVTSSDLSDSVLPGGGFDLALVPFEASAYPSATATYYSSTASLTSPGGDVDWSGFSDPHLDTLLTEAVEQLGSNLANPLYQQADVELWQQMPTLPLFAEPSLLVNSAWVNGVQDDAGGLGPMFYATAWYRLGPGRSKGASS